MINISSACKENTDSTPLPYGRQWIEDDDIKAVVEVLRSDWLTSGPVVDEFEREFADYTGAREAVTLSNGTAALHAIMHALGISSGDEAIVPSMTFAATANAVVFQGGKPVFADVDPETLLIDPEEVEKKITARTKAIVAVEYAGQTCDYDSLRDISRRHGIALISDACHALGARYRGQQAGTLADMTAFSFHPVKHITTGEGGMVTTDDAVLADKIRRFRNHGIDLDHRRRGELGTWRYDMVDLGYNYRLTDIQCALGLSQLSKLPLWITRRREIAGIYNAAFSGHQNILPLTVRPENHHAYHLFVIRCLSGRSNIDRANLYARLRARGIGVNVHYIPVHLHPFYQERFGCRRGDCPNAEAAYEQIISLPIFPRMQDIDVDRVIDGVISNLEVYAAK